VITARAPDARPQDPVARFAVLQEILCCPETRTPLRLVGIEELIVSLPDDERRRIPVGAMGAFVSDAARRAYPLVGRVANFLERECLRTVPAPPGTISSDAHGDESLKSSVKEWYDQFGWRRNDRGLYNDSAMFSQDRPVGYGLYELMSHLSFLDRLPGGDWMIDAASGALAHPEHLGYSWFYKHRVCVDMSITAMEEADAKLGETDFCCLADICRMPFRDDAFDGAVSGYTIQHIPESQQQVAVEELYRISKPGAHLCILTEVVRSQGHQALFLLLRMIMKALKVLGVAQAPSPGSRGAEGAGPPHPLYFSAHDRGWWKTIAGGLTDSYSIEALRLLRKAEFEYLFGRSNRAVKALRWFESGLPSLTSRLSAFCLVDICKPSHTAMMAPPR
jgi:SAM-dependent methyltransferase/uncharacterized protein YbaR (Trm112 family)